jgi:hypothetical protein
MFQVDCKKYFNAYGLLFRHIYVILTEIYYYILLQQRWVRNHNNINMDTDLD